MSTLGTGEAQSEVRALRETENQLNGKVRSQEAQIARLKAQVAELRSRVQQADKIRKQLDKVQESDVYQAMTMLEDYDFEHDSSFGPDFKCFSNFFQDVAASLLDGRCPIKSIPMMKMFTMAANIRKNSTNKFKFPDAIKQYTSQALKTEGARAAITLFTGPLGAKLNTHKFRGVIESRSNDPSIPSVRTIQRYDKQNFNVPSRGVNEEQCDLLVKHLRERGVIITPPTHVEPGTVQPDDWFVAQALLVSYHTPDMFYGYESNSDTAGMLESTRMSSDLPHSPWGAVKAKKWGNMHVLARQSCNYTHLWCFSVLPAHSACCGYLCHPLGHSTALVAAEIAAAPTSRTQTAAARPGCPFWTAGRGNQTNAFCSL